SQAVQRWSAVEQNRVILDHFFEDVPHDGILLLHQLFGLFNCRAMAALLQPVIDERLKQLERHLFRQATLMQLQVGTDHDNGTAGIVDALAEQVLPEAALLAFQRIGERLQRAVVSAAQYTAAASVVEQRIHRFLQHALFIAHNDIGSVQLHQLFQPVVAVDYAAIEIVEVGSGETAAIEGHQRAQLRRNDRNDIEDHPLRFVTGFPEALGDAKTLCVFQLLLRGSLGLHLLANHLAERFNIHALQQLFHALGAHHRDELAGEFLIELALALVADYLAHVEPGRFTGIDNDVGFVIEDALQFAQGDIEQIADTAGKSFEEPDVRTGARQFDMAQALAAHSGKRNFNTTLVANDAAVLHPLIFAAQTLPISHWAEDASAKQAVALRLEGAVVNSF